MEGMVTVMEGLFVGGLFPTLFGLSWVHFRLSWGLLVCWYWVAVSGTLLVWVPAASISRKEYGPKLGWDKIQDLRLRLPITAKDKGQLELAQIILQHVITTNIYIIISYDVFLFPKHEHESWVVEASASNIGSTHKCPSQSSHHANAQLAAIMLGV